jgi:hypothetical protein
VDETGQPEGATPAENGNGTAPRVDRARLNGGWAALDAAWSQAGAALEPGPEPVVPGWRRVVDNAPRGWGEPPSRYADLLTPGDSKLPAPHATSSPRSDASEAVPAVAPGGTVPAGAGTAGAAAPAAAQTAWRPEYPTIPVPRSAPPAERGIPIPEEPRRRAGINDATPAEGSPIVYPAGRGQASAPPATSTPPAISAQPGYVTAPQAYAEPAPAGYGEPTPGYAVPPGFRPRQPTADPYAGEPLHPTPPAAPVSGAPTAPTAPAASAASIARFEPAVGEPVELPKVSEDHLTEPTDVLPQRVPSEPDVPTVPEPPEPEPPAETPELARIATHLRRDDVPPHDLERPAGFDVAAILAAVRGVAGVRDASLRTNPGTGHTLRLDLAEGADPAQISRVVARMLQERMGLAAAPRGESWPAGHRRAMAAEPPERPGRHLEPMAQTRRWPRPVARGRAKPYPVSAATPYPDSAAMPYPASAATPYPDSAATAYPEPTVLAEQAAGPGPLNLDGRRGPRVVIDQVQVRTVGLDANVEVRLVAGDKQAVGLAEGPATTGYILRLCAIAAASAIDELLRDADTTGDLGRCFLEHATVVPLGGCDVAVVVVLLMCGGWVEQLAGSAVVTGDPRQAVVRATLAAVNRRVEALLA